ncbi:MULTISPECIES: ABC transporter permease [Metabacillus]|jgi:NitT/TauT family transport system permease protein|uniref:ABC transporter permease n=1 Tax=Metabacillus rhizolycopersici TaxID=2875709 RepID=A0ABS7UN98_9BACI|nr:MULTISPECIES: ABC transporter permease [Metabacillus]MBZ5749522.1 ABC transporter permease [Metabacillus rhizolycopersici]MCM3653297.1 ABC transporter permease [Metabacillus litoralis]
MASFDKSVTIPMQTSQRVRFSFHWTQKFVKQTAVIFLLLVLWEVAPRIELVDITFFPPFSTVVEGWWGLVISGELYAHFQASIIRSLIGFGLAILIAIPLGLVIGWYPFANELLNPVLELFRNTAALALLPVFILLLGIGETSKVSIVLFACIFPILLNTINAVRNVDPLLIKSAKSMGLPSYKLFYKVILPASIPTIFTGIRMAGTSSILVLIAAEMVGAKEGLGYLINYAQMNFQIPQMYAGIMTISILGFVLNFMLVSLERKFSSWKTNPNEK